MVKTVIKKNGKKESFIKEKIIVSAVKAGAPVEIARKIADKVEEHPEESIKTIWVRKKVLEELEYHNPDWPKRWLNYDKNVKRLRKLGN
jgi:transcriptional regulator NrdR family protein